MLPPGPHFTEAGGGPRGLGGWNHHRLDHRRAGYANGADAEKNVPRPLGQETEALGPLWRPEEGAFPREVMLELMSEG